MGETTDIEWCDHTFNPWWGCARVSDACRFCYAETLGHRFNVEWGKSTDRKMFGDKHWNDPVRWDRKAAADGVRRRVFCASMADVFEGRDDLDEPRTRLWSLIEATPNLDWLLLTKRPENILPMVPGAWLTDWPVNAWAGTTVENQAMADLRIPYLTAVPAPVRFLSMEPLLEAVDPDLTGIHWVICGGESGPGARPMHPEWARRLRDRCLDRTEPCEIPDEPLPHSVGVPGGGRACACAYPDPVPFLFKQAGTVLAKEWGMSDKKGGKLDELPVEFRIREYPSP